MLQTKIKMPIPEEVEASANRAMYLLAKDHDLMVGLLSKADAMTTVVLAGASKPEDYARVVHIGSRLATLISPVTACSLGCSHCCKQAVTITSGEARSIGEAIGVTPAKAVPEMDQGAVVSKYLNTVCPFLKQGACSIYEHRPQACRLHFNITEFPQLCDTVNHPGSDVPNFDLRPVWALFSAFAVVNDEYPSDIRQFFPEGANPTETL